MSSGGHSGGGGGVSGSLAIAVIVGLSSGGSHCSASFSFADLTSCGNSIHQSFIACVVFVVVYLVAIICMSYVHSHGVAIFTPCGPVTIVL